MRVAIITDRDQESAFPLPDYAQVYNKKRHRKTDRQTNTYYYYIHIIMNKDDCNAPHLQPPPPLFRPIHQPPRSTWCLSHGKVPAKISLPLCLMSGWISGHELVYLAPCTKGSLA